jgi:carbamate kinase
MLIGASRRRRQLARLAEGVGEDAVRRRIDGPKVEAACKFAAATGKSAAIGALADLGKILAGDAGTTISKEERGITYAD